MEENHNKYADNAIKWAKGHLNSKEYCYRCLAFVEDALERSNNIEIFGGDTAKESADLYEAHKHTDMPPKGSFVFMIALEQLITNIKIGDMLAYLLVMERLFMPGIR